MQEMEGETEGGVKNKERGGEEEKDNSPPVAAFTTSPSVTTSDTASVPTPLPPADAKSHVHISV